MDATQREIIIAEYNVEGEQTPTETHYFIVMTKQGYNKASTGVTAIPLTSKGDNPFILNYGMDISDEDIQDSPCVIFKKPTFIYCNRLVRINRNKIKPLYQAILKEHKWNLLLDRLFNFLKEGTKQPH